MHLSYKGVSILGDKQYGKKKLKFKKINEELTFLLNSLQGQLLHAETIEFTHPTKINGLSLNLNYQKILKKCNLSLKKFMVEKINLVYNC